MAEGKRSSAYIIRYAIAPTPLFPTFPLLRSDVGVPLSSSLKVKTLGDAVSSELTSFLPNFSIDRTLGKRRLNGHEASEARNCRTLNLGHVFLQGFRKLATRHHLLRLVRVCTQHLTWKLL